MLKVQLSRGTPVSECGVILITKGVGKKNFRGGEGGNNKKYGKIALLSLYLLYLYICTMYENPEGGTAPLPPAAEAHAYNS